MALQDELNKALENVTDLQYNTRITICRSCPAYTIIKTCSDCKCIIPVKAKLKSQSCPRGFWK